MRLLFTSFILSLFCSCTSLRVTTNILKTYPPLEQTDSVTLYELGETPPNDAILIGEIKVIDNVNSKSFRFEEIVKVAKNETRKMGGTAFCVTKVVTPSVSGNSSYEILGTAMYRDLIHPGKISQVSQNEDLGSLSKNEKRRRLLPSGCDFSVNYGYGQMVGRTKNISKEEERFEKEMNSGYVLDARLSFYPKRWRGMGIGLMNSNFLSSINFQNTDFDAYVYYVGPSFLYKTYLSKSSQRWFFKAEYGLGYIGYRMRQQLLVKDFDVTASTIGINLGAGFEYSFTKELAFEVNMVAITGLVSKLKYSDGSPSVTLEGEKRMNASRYNFTFGLIFYLNKRK